MKKKILSITNIGSIIREKRVELNYTQDDLADALGITKTAVSNWENGNSLVDVKYLVPLSNIFSVTVDDILFSHLETKTEYSDLTRQFEVMNKFELTDIKLCRHLLDSYINSKNEIVDLIKQYIENKDETILVKIKKKNKFCFQFDLLMPIDAENIEEAIRRKWNIEDYIETRLAPSLCNDIEGEVGEQESKFPHIFLDNFLSENREDWWGYTMTEQVAMANLIFNLGGRRIFKNYINSFTQIYKNDMLSNLIRINKIKNPNGDFDKQTLKAIKWMLKADAEYWVNGENRTEELMKKVL